MNAGDILRRSAKRYPNKIALVFEDSRFSFKEFNCRVNKLANALLKLGMDKGDRIAILAENCNQCVEAFYAAVKIGMVMAPINPHLSSQEIHHLITNAEATVVIVADRYKEFVQSLWPQLPSVRGVIIIGSPWKEMKGYEEFISASSPEEPRDIAITESDLFCLVLTAGTTGIPKQVMRTYRAVIADLFNVLLALHISTEDIGLLASPPYWASFLTWFTAPFFYMGASVVVTTGLNLKSVLELIDKEKVTTTVLPSSFIGAAVAYPELDKYDLSSLRIVGLTGGTLQPEIMKKAVEKIGRIFMVMYSTSEVTNITYLSPKEMMFEGLPDEVRRLRSCGRDAAPLNVDVRIVDDEGRNIAPGEVGEVIARGDHMMSGYLNMPEVTNEVLKGGYFHTGDLATIDEQGYIYLLDRKKDAIVSDGKAIASSDVEGVIYSHPSVLEAAVIGVPHAELGQTVMAVVVLKEGKKTTAEQIIELCAHNLPSYVVPQSVEFTDKLPRNVVGKVQKHVLRQKYSAEAK